MSIDGGPGPEVSRRLGYLFKHAQMRMQELNAEALAPFGIDPRELGILLVIASHEPGSQQQAAQRLGIDRTSMVARIDDLDRSSLLRTARATTVEDHVLQIDAGRTDDADAVHERA